MWLANNVTPELFIFGAVCIAVWVSVVLIKEKIEEYKERKKKK